MGMSGKLVFTKLNEKKIYKTSFYYNLNLLKKHNHIYFKFNNGLKLIYNDVRRFGFFKLYNNEKLNKINFLKKIPLDQAYIANQDYYLAIGRLTNQKNFSFLINAFSEIIDQLLIKKLCIIGDGEQRNFLNELIIRKNLQKKKSFKKDNILSYIY